MEMRIMHRLIPGCIEKITRRQGGGEEYCSYVKEADTAAGEASPKMRPVIKRLSILYVLILSALLFMNAIPSFADGNLKYYYDGGNRLLFQEDTATARLLEYHYDDNGNLIQKIVRNPSTISNRGQPYY